MKPTTSKTHVGSLSPEERAVLDRLRQQMHSLTHPYPEVRVFVKGRRQPDLRLGSYGLVLQYDDHVVEESGADWEATHHQMELEAVVDALRALHEPHEVDVYSSSEWLIKCARGEYYRGCYLDLWAELDELAEAHIVEWHWVRGSPELSRAHELARKAALQVYA